MSEGITWGPSDTPPETASDITRRNEAAKAETNAAFAPIMHPVRDALEGAFKAVSERMGSSALTDPHATPVPTDNANVAYVRALKATLRSADGDIMLREYDALRDLFVRYLTHVVDITGRDFLGDSSSDVVFSDADRAHMELLSCMAFEQVYGDDSPARQSPEPLRSADFKPTKGEAGA